MVSWLRPTSHGYLAWRCWPRDAFPGARAGLPLRADPRPALQVADGEHALQLAGVESSSTAAELLTTRQASGGGRHGLCGGRRVVRPNLQSPWHGTTGP